MTEKKVLTVIENGVLIHIGQPDAFNTEKLIEYCLSGCRVQTFSLDEFKSSGWRLYEKVPIAEARIKELEAGLQRLRRGNLNDTEAVDNYIHQLLNK